MPGTRSSPNQTRLRRTATRCQAPAVRPTRHAYTGRDPACQALRSSPNQTRLRRTRPGAWHREFASPHNPQFGSRPLHAHVSASTRSQFSMRQLRERVRVVAAIAEGRDELRQAGDAAELGGYEGAVEVGAERDMVDRPSARRGSRRDERSPTSGVSSVFQPSSRRKPHAKLTPTTPPVRATSSSCASVRFRVDGAERMRIRVGRHERRIARCARRPRIPPRSDARGRRGCPACYTHARGRARQR